MAKKGRTVSKRPDGQWANTLDGASRASSLHSTQQEAAQKARTQLKSDGGGELKIKNEEGKIRSKDTVPPAKDPYPPKG
jgi:hypothetical protein